MTHKITAQELVVEARNVALEKSTAMGQAGVAERAREYASLEFQESTGDSFEAIDPNGDTGLLDVVLDEVEGKHPIEFWHHRYGGGKQTITWTAG
jgi:hypothetical protein